MGYKHAASIHPPHETGRISLNKTTLQIAGIHIICWVIFLSLPALFNDRIDTLGIVNILKDMVGGPFRIVNNIFFIALFYYSYYIAIPNYYFTHKYTILVLYFVASFGVFVLLNYMMMPPAMPQTFDGPPRPQFHMLGPSFNLFMYIITCILSFALCLYNKWRNVYEEKLNTEISFLKAQINPHFLFNTLNSIYSLALIRSEATPEAVLKLSGIMRYAISEANQKYVSLDKEISYIYDYIELQKMRLHPEVELKYTITGEASGKQVAPFMLIPFVENAFKYGVNGEEQSSLVIDIAIQENELLMNVSNLKVTVIKNKDNQTGLGINNTRQRLDLLYPDRYTLTINDTNEAFTVLLKIQIA